jgi:oxygen-dependent protoporphyrinogen oxidase
VVGARAGWKALELREESKTDTPPQIQDLDLVDQVLYTQKSDPGAKNRFIYYPDRLNRLPSSVPSLAEVFALWRTGILSGIAGLLTEPMRRKRPTSMTDETVGSFLSRRVDKRIANNIVSAVFHGIWAGDIHQLSAKTLLGQAWQLEGRYGNALGGYYRMQNEDQGDDLVVLAHPWDLEQTRRINDEIDLEPGFEKKLKGCSHFTFKEGIQTLYRGLQKAVEDKGNVEIRTEAPIQSFKPLEGGGLGVEVVYGVRPHPLSSPSQLWI